MKAPLAQAPHDPGNAVSADAGNPRLVGLAPVVNRSTQIIIFGSFPGARSLEEQRYYAHPQNQFWKLLGEALEEPLPAMLFRQRLTRIRAHGIGLWDVIASCERNGSLDSAIKAAQFNDFGALKKRCPQWRLACFNGQTSGRSAAEIGRFGIAARVLPSSSPAHAGMSFSEKLVRWRAALRGVAESAA